MIVTLHWYFWHNMCFEKLCNQQVRYILIAMATFRTGMAMVKSRWEGGWQWQSGQLEVEWSGKWSVSIWQMSFSRNFQTLSTDPSPLSPFLIFHPSIMTIRNLHSPHSHYFQFRWLKSPWQGQKYIYHPKVLIKHPRPS